MTVPPYRIAEARQDCIETVTRALHAWLAGDDLCADQVRAKVDRLLQELLAEDRCGATRRRDPAAKAVRLQADMQAEMEMAARPEGELPYITGQQLNAWINSNKELARLIREIVEER
jgi:hypothetical protein